MKKVALLLMLLTASVSFAQLKRVVSEPKEVVGKIQSFGSPVTAECYKMGGKCYITYQNLHTSLKDDSIEFSFEDKDNMLEDLYLTIQEGFQTMPKEAIKLEVSGYIVSLTFKKSLGIQTVDFSASGPGIFLDNYSSPFNKKQIDKLFGKAK